MSCTIHNRTRRLIIIIKQSDYSAKQWGRAGSFSDIGKVSQAWREQIKHFCRRVFSKKKKEKKKDASTLKNKWEGGGWGKSRAKE